MNNTLVPKPACSRGTLFALLVLLWTPATVSAQAIVGIEVNTPRNFGYTIGDKIRHEMQLSLRAPYQLDMSTLPETGRLNRWLEVSAASATVQNRDDADIYRITIDYQIFNAPQALSTVTIPQLEFILTGGISPLPVFLPEWTFSIAPIAPPGPRPEMRLQPDRQPLPIDVSARRVRLWTWTFLIFGLTGYLAYSRWLLPRLSAGRFPFSAALRELQRLANSESNPDSFEKGLRTFHAALNTTATHVVFGDDLQDFLSAYPHFGALEDEFEAFFAQSRNVFFDDVPFTAPHDALQTLVDLCSRCRALERSVA